MFSAGLSIHVIDPLNRTGKVAIPAHLVSDTKGLDDYRTAVERQEVKDFSLCLLFQKGRCNAGSRCHQIHASPEFVAELREKAASVKCCCAEHGDMHSHGYVHAPQIIRVVDAASTTSYHMSAFARTACLDTLLRSVRASNTEVIVPANKICRLHAQRRCKFGKDCKNVHLCPSATPLIDAKPVKAAVVTPSPKPRVVAPSAAAAPVAAVTTAPAATVSAVPALGMAFRAIDITNRACDVSVSSISSERSASKPSSEDSGAFIASARPACLSLLSGMDEFEFNSIRTHNAGDYLDPLDILDNGSSFSDLSARDFDAFVDALCECGPDTTLASPHWIAA